GYITKAVIEHAALQNPEQHLENQEELDEEGPAAGHLHPPADLLGRQQRGDLTQERRLVVVLEPPAEHRAARQVEEDGGHLPALLGPQRLLLVAAELEDQLVRPLDVHATIPTAASTAATVSAKALGTTEIWSIPSSTSERTRPASCEGASPQMHTGTPAACAPSTIRRI